MRQDEMRGVAAGADGRDGQPPFEEPLTMDALHVVLEDLVLRDVMRALDGRTLMVTASAQAGNLGGEGG